MTILTCKQSMACISLQIFFKKSKFKITGSRPPPHPHLSGYPEKFYLLAARFWAPGRKLFGGLLQWFPFRLVPLGMLKSISEEEEEPLPLRRTRVTGPFFKITLTEKPHAILYIKNSHISKSRRSMNLILVSY